MREYIPRIHAAGGELVIVGNGTPEHVRWFIEDYGFQTPVYTDPTLQVYEAVEARRGMRLTKLPGLIANAARAIRKGHFQTRVLGDGQQLGGVFVITPDQEFAFRYLSEVAGDHPPPEQVVAALEAVRQA